jgi:hypothetical protein
MYTCTHIDLCAFTLRNRERETTEAEKIYLHAHVYTESLCEEISTVTDQIWRYRERQTTEAVTDARVYNVLVALDTLSPHCSVPGTIPYISTLSSIYCSVPGHNIVHQYFIIYLLLCT